LGSKRRHCFIKRGKKKTKRSGLTDGGEKKTGMRHPRGKYPEGRDVVGFVGHREQYKGKENTGAPLNPNWEPGGTEKHSMRAPGVLGEEKNRR